jgi:orotate phosphoribosyltransferase
MTTLEEQSFDKYHLNLNNLKSDDRFILIDDVVGTGTSLCETMAKLYEFNQKINYFFIVVKDVKR